MYALRAFSKALTKLAIRSIRRRAVRGLVKSVVRRTLKDIVDVDDTMDDITDQIDVLEALELVAEAPAILQNARDSAGAGAVTTFSALMEQFNPGQRSLVEQYCIPYAQEYWETTMEPDPDVYESGMFSLHEAIEQALSDAVSMSYEAARSSGAGSLVSDLSAYVSTALLERGIMSMTDIKKIDNDWSRLKTWADKYVTEAYGAATEMGIPTSAMRWRNGEFMVIGDHADQFYGSTRQLSWSQFMGADQPYWFTESRRMQMAASQGHMSWSEYESRRTQLYQASYNNPWSTSPPGGYRPYNGPEWKFRGYGY